MKTNTRQTWFTLIEVIVALTVFSLIMVSVMTIFYLASQMSTRVELNRHMQENVKNTLDIISEDIRTWNIDWVREFAWLTCQTNDWESSHVLCISRSLNNIEIWLWEKISDTSWNIINGSDYCSDIARQCHILKRENGWEWYPLTNSMSHITRLDFTFWNPGHPKIMINLGIRPALMQGMASNLLESQEIAIQTTLSERFIQQN